MKLFKHKHFMSLLYSIMVALPFFAILGRVIYTQTNHNANQSYSDYKEIVDITNVNQFETGKRYSYKNFGLINSTGQTGSVANNFITYENVKLLYESSNNGLNTTILNSIKMGLYKVDGNTYISLFFYNDDNQSQSYSTGVGYFEFEFTFTGITSNVNFIEFFTNQNSFQNISINNTLDNAFEYSLSTFIEDNNFGNLDFFSWFSDIFLDTSNTHNMLYINFVNWYLNYTLFISLAYVLFLVLMWFVSFVRRLLENTQNMNIGGL